MGWNGAETWVSSGDGGSGSSNSGSSNSGSSNSGSSNSGIVCNERRVRFHFYNQRMIEHFSAGCEKVLLSYWGIGQLLLGWFNNSVHSVQMSISPYWGDNPPARDKQLPWIILVEWLCFTEFYLLVYGFSFFRHHYGILFWRATCGTSYDFWRCCSQLSQNASKLQYIGHWLMFPVP